MDEHFYVLSYCPFCGEVLDEELKDEIADWDEDG
jgi:hypothetical protein